MNIHRSDSGYITDDEGRPLGHESSAHYQHLLAMSTGQRRDAVVTEAAEVAYREALTSTPARKPHPVGCDPFDCPDCADARLVAAEARVQAVRDSYVA